MKNVALEDNMAAGYALGMAAALGTLAGIKPRSEFAYETYPPTILRETPRNRQQQRARQARMAARRRR